MNLGQIAAAAAGRSQLDANDPWYSRVKLEAVMPAIRDIEMMNVRGWDWLWFTLDFTLSSGDYQVPFSELAANTALPYTGMEIVRVHALAADGASTGLYSDLTRLNRRDLEELRTPTSVLPTGAAWTVEGQTLIVAPTPTADLPLRARVLAAERDLTEDGAELVMPTRYHNTVVDLARAYVYEMKGDDDRGRAARERAERVITRAMGHSRPWGGPGSTPLEG